MVQNESTRRVNIHKRPTQRLIVFAVFGFNGIRATSSNVMDWNLIETWPFARPIAMLLDGTSIVGDSLMWFVP